MNPIRRNAMSRHEPQRFYRVELVDKDSNTQHFYVWSPNEELAISEAERWTGADAVIVDDCTPRRKVAA